MLMQQTILSRTAILCLIVTSCVFFIHTTAFSNDTDTLDRDYEPVVVTGNSLTEFLSVNTSQLFVYKYIAASGAWTQIPFQFDDVGSNGSYFSESDGVLDTNDELAFMAKDMGDQAPNYLWLDNASARSYRRYEITVTDGTDPNKKAWAYV